MEPMKPTATIYCEEGCEASLKVCEVAEKDKKLCYDKYRDCVTECETLGRPKTK